MGMSYRAENYCDHGNYVGGCGIDWMCHWCEEGISQTERLQIEKDWTLSRLRARCERIQRFLTLALSLNINGIEAADMAARIQ
jgi:hypothetical protein